MIRSDVYFTPTPDRVIVEMLRIAAVRGEDVVMDLGCGDGRILVEAARSVGARGIGVDLDEALLEHGRDIAEKAGVGTLVEFRREDFFTTDISECSVMMLYLMDSLNVALRPRILAETRPGTRVVTYSFEMGDWPCDEHVPIAANGVSLWIVPAIVGGSWKLTGPDWEQDVELAQHYQMISGKGLSGAVVTGRLAGTRISLELHFEGKDSLLLRGDVDGNEMLLTDTADRRYQGVRVANDPAAV